MKKKISIILIFILISNLSFSGIFSFKKNSRKNQNKKIKIITTLFPVYDFTKQIAGGKADVDLLLKPGKEAHSFDPSPRDIVNISKAEIFVYTNEIMEPWIDKIKQSVNVKKIIFVEAGEGIILEEHEHEGEQESGHHYDQGTDPHIWTNPLYAIKMTKNILNALIKADTENADYYRERADDFINELIKLDAEIENRLKNTKRRIIVTGGHFAMSYFAERYNLNYISAYEGFAPNAEPKPKDVAKLRNFIKNNNIKYIYYEELVNPKIAKILADENGVKMLLLHGAHNISKKELSEEITYINIMKNNLKNLELGLNYNE